mmetsp:Transcript_3791/g.5293  ORF Transcript_3791/g.5293 Transcript_3791/m.5293 type:complete len:238 (-) Transcript_3791:408-1121(-)|eukprot:CAMPEP_0117764800 /NCGR_PEP_ID=MMETSP0947-20121206/19655_1 /TAXON_ID=44440 /ORGANISM="Chattonella subsalsa, Strain CCMP2191" /LENGTH=237 /DNA_ID=CAMNT_0005587179 /DNA_START=124 /DNA_END=837 /DNA_ORIENTATION=+
MALFADERPMMRFFCERTEDGDSPILSGEDDENLLFRLNDVKLIFDSENDQGEGNLFVTSDRIIWLSQADHTKACAFDVPFIILHAISNDPETHSRPCIYCQLDSDSEDLPRESKFVPSDESKLQSLFKAFCDAAALNPDPPEPGEQEGDDELIFNEEEVEFNTHQMEMLQNFDNMLTVQPSAVVGQFDDAEESMESESAILPLPNIDSMAISEDMQNDEQKQPEVEEQESEDDEIL